MKYRKGYKYQLAKDEVFIVPIHQEPIETQFIDLIDGTLTVKSGYAWDGASGGAWDDNHNLRASLQHDALYQLMRKGLLSQEYRKTIDYTLYCTCLEDGMNKIRARFYYWAVRKFAAPAASPKNVKEILEAP